MAVDRRAKPYYYLSCADVDNEYADLDEDALSNCSREDVARFLVSFLCKTKGKNTLENILTRQLQPLKRWDVTSPSALREFCQSFPQCFIIHGLPGAEASYVEVEVMTEVNLCNTHLKKMGSCPEDGECGSLHLCRFFMLAGQCECGTPKQVRRLYGHQLHSDHNISVLKSHLMDHLTLEEVQTLVRRPNARREQTRPLVCRFYNNQTGCCKEDRCLMLHLCKHFVFTECKFAKDCMRSHDPTESQAKAILDSYAIAPEDLLFIMQQDGSHEKNVPHPFRALHLTSAMGRGSAVFPPQWTHQAEGMGKVWAVSGEKDEVRGGHWLHPSLKGSSEAGSTAVRVEGEQSKAVGAEPTVYSTLFSRRRGHVAASSSEQQSFGMAAESENEGSTQPPPTTMNPFSYMTVQDSHCQAGLAGRPAATMTSVNVQSDCMDSTSKAGQASQQARDGPLAQSQDSNFIPLKQVDKTFGLKLTPGRPVASVTPQMKIKPELGICRKMDVSSEGAEFGSKERRDSSVNKELNVNTDNQAVQGFPELSSSEKPSPASTSSQAASLHSIITNLIDNVKKLHAKNPGPERHLMNYLSELAQPDKLDREMKAAEENEGKEGGRGASPVHGENYRSDGELSDSDHEVEDSVNPVQEKVLFDYNHRPTVDLISDMLNSREDSPCGETPEYDPSVSRPSGPHRARQRSSSGGYRRSGSHYETEQILKAERDLEEVSSANSAISDIMSSEEDPQDGDNLKASVSHNDSKNEDKTSKDSQNVNNIQQGTDTKSPEKPLKNEKLTAQTELTESCGQQSLQDVKSSSGDNMVPETVPIKNISADETTTTVTNPDSGQKDPEKSAPGSDPSVEPVRSGSSTGNKSPCQGSSTPAQKHSSPDNLSSDARKSSAGAEESCKESKSANKQTSSESARSGVQKSSMGNRSSSHSRSSSGNKGSSQGNKRSPQRSRKSPGKISRGHRKSPGSRSSDRKNSKDDSKRSCLENKSSEDSRRASSDKNRSSERRHSSDRRASDPKRSDYEQRRRTPSLQQSSGHHRRSSASPRKYLSDPRGCTSHRREWSPGYRKRSQSPRHRRSPGRTRSFDKEQYTGRWPSIDQYREGADRSDRGRPRPSSPDSRDRNAGRREKDWDGRWKERSREDAGRGMDDQSRSRENTRVERDREDRRWRSRSHERGFGSVERYPRDQHDRDSRNEKPWRHSRHEDRHTGSPSRDRNRFQGAEREGRAGRRSISPSRHRHRSISPSRERSERGRRREQFDGRDGSMDRGGMSHHSGGYGHRIKDEQWPDDEDPPRRSDEFFEGERFFEASAVRESPDREEFCQRPNEEFWDQDSLGSRSRTCDVKEDRFRNRLGPSPIRSRDQQRESILPHDDSLHRAREHHRSPFAGRHDPSSGVHDSGESRGQCERPGSPFLHETGFDRVMNWHEDSDSADRHGSSRMRSKSNKFANYSEWKRFNSSERADKNNSLNSPLTEREVILQRSSQSEEERLLTPPYREHSRTDRKHSGTPRGSSPAHQGSSRSPSAGFRYDGRTRPERSSHHHGSSRDACHADDSRYSPAHRRCGPATDRKGPSLRDQIEDLLDKARHSDSRGASPFQELDENFRTVVPPDKAAEMDRRLDFRENHTDRSPEHHSLDHSSHRQFHSPKRRTNSAYQGLPSKRPREPSDREKEHTLEHKRRRDRSGDRMEGDIEMGWEDEESMDPENQPHRGLSTRHRTHPPEESAIEVRANIPRWGRGRRSRGRYHYRGNPRTFAGNRGGIEIKRVFNNNNRDMGDEGFAPYGDLGQPYADEEDDAFYSQGQDTQTEENFYGENFDDGIDEENFHGEEDGGLDENCRERQGDVGDMIRAQRARVMRSDLRNLLKTRRNSRYSEAESEHIQIRVRRHETREHVPRNQYMDEDGREVLFTDY